MSVNTDQEQMSVPCSIMRAGTSKGVFFREEDIPAPGPARDMLLKQVMGFSDVLQIDGLGGSRLVTSKIAIVARSTRADADVDYTYAIVPPERDQVVYTSNCGNISSGVGPFAIDTGMVTVTGPVTPVRIFNTNTRKILVAHVPVRNGVAQVEGDFSIPGVNGCGAEIKMDYRGTIGAKTGRMLPTGKVVDTLVLSDGRRIEATLGDVANPCLFLRARDVGLQGTELPDAINANAPLIALLDEIRARGVQMIGLCDDWRDADRASPSLPLVVLVHEAVSYPLLNGGAARADSMDLSARLVFYRKCHESMAGTGSMCTAAMSRIPGTLVHEMTMARAGSDGGTSPEGALRIGHPSGVMRVNVAAHLEDAPGGLPEVRFDILGFSRTARRIMEGRVFVRASALHA